MSTLLYDIILKESNSKAVTLLKAHFEMLASGAKRLVTSFKYHVKGRKLRGHQRRTEDGGLTCIKT